MKSLLSATLMLMLFSAPGYGQHERAPQNAGQPAEPPSVGIHVAALEGNIDVIGQHIKAGSDLNQKDAYGSTPLVVAVTFGNAEVAEALVEAGADTGIRTNDGSTPLFLAAFFGREEVARVLLESGADKYARNMDGATALDIVTTPFEDYKGIYDQLVTALGPLGFKLDYEQIEAAHPRIAEMLRPGAEELEAVEYAPPTGKDWTVSTPAEQGLDPDLVAELYLDAAHMDNVYGLLIIKNGYLIAEGYFNEGRIHKKELMQSVSKSYDGALIGLALEQGCISSLDQRMIDFFPELADEITDPRKKEITIRQMLQMRGGYPWEESDPALWETFLDGDYLPLIEGFQLVNDPGTAFNYSNFTSYLLGVIVARACDTDLWSYAEEHLLSPIGSGAGEWYRDRYGYYYSLFKFTARDAAKFGQLYLDGGEYGGKQILSADWVKESLQDYSGDTWVVEVGVDSEGRYFRDLGYGYQWWSARIGDRRVDYAAGHGGQLIVLLHDLDMVVVLTSHPFFLQHDEDAWKHQQASFNLVGKFISSLPGED